MFTPPLRGLDLIESFDRFQIDQNVGRDEPLLHHARADRCRRRRATPCGPPAAPAGQASRRAARSRALALVKVFMRSRPQRATILSRVIGRSFMRRPIALKIALATAADAGTLLDSPMLFAPNGP